MPKLNIKNRKTQEEQLYEMTQDSLLFGRLNTCDIELPSKAISRRHAEILREKQDFFIRDLGSGNGTYLNKKKLTPQEKHLIRPGDTVQIEEYEIRLSLDDQEDFLTYEENTDTDILEIKLIKKMMRALDNEETPSLEVLNGTSAGKRVFLAEDKKEFIIGRGDECDLSLAENVLTRTHAKLEQKWGGVVITDLGSKNGTFVNNERVQEKLLRDGNRIMLGTIKFLYRNPKEVNAQIAHQELKRKKREAALQQAELLAKQQEEEALRKKEAEAQAEAQKAAEAQEVEKALEKEAEEPPPAEPSPPPEEVSAPEPTAEPEIPPPSPEEIPPPPATAKPKFSTLEKLMIGVGAVVGLVALVAILLLFV